MKYYQSCKLNVIKIVCLGILTSVGSIYGLIDKIWLLRNPKTNQKIVLIGDDHFSGTIKQEQREFNVLMHAIENITQACGGFNLLVEGLGNRAENERELREKVIHHAFLETPGICKGASCTSIAHLIHPISLMHAVPYYAKKHNPKIQLFEIDPEVRGHLLGDMQYEISKMLHGNQCLEEQYCRLFNARIRMAHHCLATEISQLMPNVTIKQLVENFQYNDLLESLRSASYQDINEIAEWTCAMGNAEMKISLGSIKNSLEKYLDAVTQNFIKQYSEKSLTKACKNLLLKEISLIRCELQKLMLIGYTDFGAFNDLVMNMPIKSIIEKHLEASKSNQSSFYTLALKLIIMPFFNALNQSKLFTALPDLEVIRQFINNCDTCPWMLIAGTNHIQAEDRSTMGILEFLKAQGMSEVELIFSLFQYQSEETISEQTIQITLAKINKIPNFLVKHQDS